MSSRGSGAAIQHHGSVQLPCSQTPESINFALQEVDVREHHPVPTRGDGIVLAELRNALLTAELSGDQAISDMNCH